MRLLAIWIGAGVVAGVVSGALFGLPYILAGAGIGAVAGLGIALGLKGAGLRASGDEPRADGDDIGGETGFALGQGRRGKRRAPTD